MIIDNSQGDVRVIGDIKEFKTSIDPRNLEFITTLLSSNLYSQPQQSFIREIVSNAWDSHVEAGTTDQPVILRLKRDSITIRDYGTGISPERFKEIYCNIGSSTKRGTNDYIGGFGIGRFSAVACSSTVYITSYYNGVAYHYMMVKSNNTITINLLMESNTDEKNGVEVSIKNIYDINPYVKALSSITFFPNVYIDCEFANYNSFKIKRFKNFAVCSNSLEQRLLLGNVLYPVKLNTGFSTETGIILSKLSNTGVVIRFDIGELDITPNRENIIYNSKSISVIESRVKEAWNEMLDIVKPHIAKDYDDIREYADVLNRDICADFINGIYNTTYSVSSVRINFLELPEAHITFKGEDYRKEASTIRSILGFIVPNFKGFVDCDTIITSTKRYSVSRYCTLKEKKILCLNRDARLLPIVKNYLKEHYNKYTVISDITRDEFKNWAKESGPILYNNLSTKAPLIISHIYDYLMSGVKRLDLNTDSDFLKYKQHARENRPKTPVLKNVILYCYEIYEGSCDYQFKRIREFKTIDAAVEHIKKEKKGIIINNYLGDSDTFLKYVSRQRGYIYIEAKKEVVEYLRKLNLSCVINNDWLLYGDPILSCVKTIRSSKLANLILSDSSIFSEIEFSMPSELYAQCMGHLRKYKDYLYSHIYCQKAERDAIPYDGYTKYICDTLERYIESYSGVKEEVGTDMKVDRTLLAAVLMKKKAYRINKQAYNAIKQNKLLNILCRK